MCSYMSCWYFTRGKAIIGKHRPLRVLQNGMLVAVLGRKREKVTSGWKNYTMRSFIGFFRFEFSQRWRCRCWSSWLYAVWTCR
jgi:hypothetical protein